MLKIGLGLPDSDFMDMITSKKVYSCLGEAKDLRDLWLGHGGIVGARESDRLLNLLEATLASIRQVISDNYGSTLLLQPESSVLSDGVRTHRARALMGSRTPFKLVTIETLTEMDITRLYLSHGEGKRPLELLPLLRIVEVPDTEQKACYFYNRLGKERTRWVSYHFRDEAEHYGRYDAVASVFALLRSASGESESCR